MNKPKLGDLRVWWIPQVPGEPFHVPVTTLTEAALVMKTLANYDKFQFENNIKPDYCNAGGLMRYELVCEDGPPQLAWCDWYDEEGNDIDCLIRQGATLSMVPL